MQLKIEYIHKEDLKPYAGNAKLHPAMQVEQIKNSIRQFGFNDPIAVWGDSEVVEGHGRLLAVMEMDEISEVPIIRLDDLSEEQKKAYSLVHNKLTMNSGFDFDLLQLELDSIDLDMEQFGFEEMNGFIDDLMNEALGSHQYDGEPTQFSVTFTIDKEYESQVLGYIGENGKEELVEAIIEKTKQWKE